MVLPASKPVCPPFCPPGICLFPLQLLVLIYSLPLSNPADDVDAHPHLNQVSSYMVLGWHQCSSVSAGAQPEASHSHASVALGKKARGDHFEETFMGLEGLWTSVRLLMDEQDL